MAVINPGWVRTDMGGPGASISPEQSDDLTMKETGSFQN